MIKKIKIIQKYTHPQTKKLRTFTKCFKDINDKDTHTSKGNGEIKKMPRI